MKNLKEVKKALNALPDELLEEMYVTHQMTLEDPQAEIGVVFRMPGNPEEEAKFREIYETDAGKVLNEFAKGIHHDALKIGECLLNEDNIENYADDL